MTNHSMCLTTATRALPVLPFIHHIEPGHQPCELAVSAKAVSGSLCRFVDEARHGPDRDRSGLHKRIIPF